MLLWHSVVSGRDKKTTTALGEDREVLTNLSGVGWCGCTTHVYKQQGREWTCVSDGV